MAAHTERISCRKWIVKNVRADVVHPLPVSELCELNLIGFLGKNEHLRFAGFVILPVSLPVRLNLQPNKAKIKSRERMPLWTE